MTDDSKMTHVFVTCNCKQMDYTDETFNIHIIK